jgi:DNA-binding CsgD family transcriptional regulator
MPTHPGSTHSIRSNGAKLTPFGEFTIDLSKLEGVAGPDLVVLERLGTQPLLSTGVAATNGANLSTLSRPARTFVEVAAVLADSFSVNDIADILGQPAGHLLREAEEAIQAGILVTTSGRLDFADEQLRRNIYEELPEPLRVGLHGHVGRLLLEQGGSPVAAALHLILGARPGDHRALEGLDRATQELLGRFAPAAAHLALSALALTEPLDSHRWTRRITAVDALVAAQRPGEALELARRSIEDSEAPGLAAAQLRLRVAANLLGQGLPDEAMVELEVLFRTNDLPDGVYGAAEMQQLFVLLAQQSFVEARDRALSVLAGSGRSRADMALAGALTTLAVLDWNEGRPQRAIGMARAATERVLKGPQAPCARIPSFVLAWMLTATGELEEATELVEAAGGGQEIPGRRLSAPAFAVLRSHVHLAAGRLEAAGTDAAEGLHLAQEQRIRLQEPPARSLLAAVALVQGNQKAATEHVEANTPWRDRNLFGMRIGAFAELQVREATSGLAAAREAMGEAMGDVAAMKRLELEDPSAAAWLVRTAMAAGEATTAEMAERCATELAKDNVDVPSVVAAADHARGLLSGDVDLLLRAAETHRWPWARARATEDAGTAVSAIGGTAAARPHLERALAAYQELGAEHDVARVRSLLRNMGVRQCHWRRRERPVSGWESLTETERAVSDLVAQGLTNRQAAEQMFLSPHTIDFHLRQIFRKLQIDSRVDLTRLTIERDAGETALT